MKLFINDWNGDLDTFVEGTEENREYPINAWIPAGDGKQVFLVSAYVYDKFIMFLYMYDLDYHPEHKEEHAFTIPKTFRESLEQGIKYIRQFRFSVQYEVNDLKNHFSGGTCYPLRRVKNILSGEPEFDKYMEMCYSEHDYLSDLMKKTNRIPEALRDKELAFGKHKVTFDGLADEIKSIKICRQEHDSAVYDAETTFTISYGECDVCVPYILSETGEESYFIVKELKLINMSEEFTKRYEELKKSQENLLENTEINGERIYLEEMIRLHNVTILTVSIMQPVKSRSFQFYTKEHLDSEIKAHTEGSFATSVFFFLEERDESEAPELYRKMYDLGKVEGEPKSEYEITLISVTDLIKYEREVLLELNFSE